MNILQITANDIKGGAAKVAHSLKKKLQEGGQKVSMFVGWKYSNDKDVFLINKPDSLAQRMRRKLTYFLANDIDIFQSDQILKTEQFKEADLIHCHILHSYYFNLNTLARISKLKPVIWTMHDMWAITPHCAHAFDGELKDGFFQCSDLDIYPPIAWHNEKYLTRKKRRIYQNSNFHIVVPSLWLKNKIEKSVLKDKPITLIYNGVDTNIFKPHSKQKLRQELNLPPDKKIILSVIKHGEKNPWKGGNYVREAIDHFKDREDVLFVSLGKISEGKGQVKNLPIIESQEKLAKYYSAADILLYPSVADNCPLVVLEAQASGLPVISFKTGGIPEIVRHKKTGYIAEYKNKTDLIKGVNYILGLTNTQQEQFKKEAVLRVKENFTLDKMVDSYLRVYRDLF